MEISYQAMPRTYELANFVGSDSAPSQFMLKCQMCWNMTQFTSIVYHSSPCQSISKNHVWFGCCSIVSPMGQKSPFLSTTGAPDISCGGFTERIMAQTNSSGQGTNGVADESPNMIVYRKVRLMLFLAHSCVSVHDSLALIWLDNELCHRTCT